MALQSKKKQNKTDCTKENEIAGTKPAVCEKSRNRDGRETLNISTFPLQTTWNPSLIGLAKVTVSVFYCVFVRKYLYTSVCIAGA